MSTTSSKKATKPRRAWLTWLIIIILIGLAVLLFLRNRQLNAQKAFAALDTATVKRETMVTSISGTGSVRPEKLETLAWSTSGHVGKVNVEAGQMVEKGELLMALDEADLPVEILQARMDHERLEGSIARLPADTDAQRAQLEAKVSAAELNLEQGEASLSELENRTCTAWHLKDLQRRHDEAISSYEAEPSQRNKSLVDAAKTNLEFCDPETLADQISDLQAQLEMQRSGIAQDLAELKKIEKGPDPATLSNLEYQLAIAAKRMAFVELRSPFDGVITAVYTQAGAPSSVGANAVQVADLSKYYIDVPVAEVDIPSVKLGQEAELVFDAYFNETYHGKVIEISRIGQEQAGVVNYSVSIEMSDGLDKINPGMTAGVTIITEAKPDVLVVPSVAVKTVQGESVVYALRNGAPEAVKIRVGAYSSENVEILEGNLQVGETLVLNPPSNIMQLFMQGNRRAR